MKGGTPTAALAEAPLHALPLPQGCLITLVLRDGDVLVPHGGTTLRHGDRLTMVGRSRRSRPLRTATAW